MLLNSPEFIFLFLPITLALFFFSARFDAARMVLVVASLLFYSAWNPANLPILLGSILGNYMIALIVFRAEGNSRKIGLSLGIAANLCLLGYFKYANWFAANANTWLGTNLTFAAIALPLGISFFTFQQIAYLVDVYQKKVIEHSPLNYVNFATFFPYIVSGPLLRYQQVAPQFSNQKVYSFQPQNLAIGLTIFAIGLFKKMVIADSVAYSANQVFELAGSTSLNLTEAWLGALAFTLQLYFDFSGYSDMAIGTARLFGIYLPLNFSSPYKAHSIIDFWRRWHITLSNFLRDYLYIPLGGNRKGEVRRYINLIVTMLIGGLWHGAGWNFVIWGGLHGLYLSVNHLWRRWGLSSRFSHFIGQKLGVCLTFIAVVVSWVFFRATNPAIAISMLKSMMGFNGIALPEFLEKPLGLMQNWGVEFGELMPNLAVEIEVIEDINEPTDSKILLIVAGLLLFVWLMPNTQQWIGQHHFFNPNSTSRSTTDIATQPFSELPGDPSGEYSLLHSKLWQKLQWRPNQFWAVITALFTVLSLLNLAKVSEFLYQEF